MDALDQIIDELVAKVDPIKRTEKVIFIQAKDLEKMDAKQFGDFLDEMVEITELIAEKIALYERFSCKGLDCWRGYGEQLRNVSSLVSKIAGESTEKAAVMEAFIAKMRAKRGAL